MDWNVAYVGPDALRRQRAKYVSTVGVQLRWIHTDGIQVPRRVHVWPLTGRIHAGKNAKRGGVTSTNLASPRQIRLVPFHLRKTKSASEVREPLVETKHHHFVSPLAVSLSLP